MNLARVYAGTGTLGAGLPDGALNPLEQLDALYTLLCLVQVCVVVNKRQIDVLVAAYFRSGSSMPLNDRRISSTPPLSIFFHPPSPLPFSSTHSSSPLLPPLPLSLSPYEDVSVFLNKHFWTSEWSGIVKAVSGGIVKAVFWVTSPHLSFPEKIGAMRVSNFGLKPKFDKPPSHRFSPQTRVKLYLVFRKSMCTIQKSMCIGSIHISANLCVFLYT